MPYDVLEAVEDRDPREAHADRGAPGGAAALLRTARGASRVSSGSSGCGVRTSGSASDRACFHLDGNRASCRAAVRRSSPAASSASSPRCARMSRSDEPSDEPHLDHAPRSPSTASCSGSTTTISRCCYPARASSRSSARWALPGGFVDVDEIDRCRRRVASCEEEAGLTASSSSSSTRRRLGFAAPARARRDRRVLTRSRSSATTGCRAATDARGWRGSRSTICRKPRVRPRRIVARGWRGCGQGSRPPLGFELLPPQVGSLTRLQRMYEMILGARSTSATSARSRCPWASGRGARRGRAGVRHRAARLLPVRRARTTAWLAKEGFEFATVRTPVHHRAHPRRLPVNDFCPGGALAVPHGGAVVAPANRLQPRVPLVVATQDWHPPTTAVSPRIDRAGAVSRSSQLGGLPQVLWPAHCVQGLPGAELVATLTAPALPRLFAREPIRRFGSSTTASASRRLAARTRRHRGLRARASRPTTASSTRRSMPGPSGSTSGPAAGPSTWMATARSPSRAPLNRHRRACPASRLARSRLGVGTRAALLPGMSEDDKDPNQGEGDWASARRYDRHVRDYVAQGGSRGRWYFEHHADEAAGAERQARHGGSRLATVDELVAKGQSVLARVRGAASNLRARLARH